MLYFSMKRLFFLLLAASPTFVFGQDGSSFFNKFYEGGPIFGFANYAGDVAESRIELGETKVGFGFFLRSHQTKNLSLRLHFITARISGDDANSPDLKDRKLSFFSSVTEFGGQVEWNIFGKDRITQTGVHVISATPYIFVGAAGAHANPTVTQGANGTALPVPLPELGLKKLFFVTPIGIGGRFDIGDRVVLGAEAGFRPVYSDDLDGVSANGNRSKKDWYYLLNGTVSYIFGNPYKIKRG